MRFPDPPARAVAGYRHFRGQRRHKHATALPLVLLSLSLALSIAATAGTARAQGEATGALPLDRHVSLGSPPVRVQMRVDVDQGDTRSR